MAHAGISGLVAVRRQRGGDVLDTYATGAVATIDQCNEWHFHRRSAGAAIFRRRTADWSTTLVDGPFGSMGYISSARAHCSAHDAFRRTDCAQGRRARTIGAGVCGNPLLVFRLWPTLFPSWIQLATHAGYAVAAVALVRSAKSAARVACRHTYGLCRRGVPVVVDVPLGDCGIVGALHLLRPGAASATQSAVQSAGTRYCHDCSRHAGATAPAHCKNVSVLYRGHRYARGWCTLACRSLGREA